MTTEQAIARDLDRIDAIMAFGTKSAQRAAVKHRKVCLAAIAEMNRAENCVMSDDDLLAELTA